MRTCDPVIYAEDEETDAYFVRRAWHESEIENSLIIVPDGMVAIDYLRGEGIYADRGQHPLPCLALLDLNMHGRSGLEVLKWIRAQPSVCTLPVIMLTSSSAAADVHRAYIQGANGFLVKPGRPAEMLTMIHSIKAFWLSQNTTEQGMSKSSP